MNPRWLHLSVYVKADPEYLSTEWLAHKLREAGVHQVDGLCVSEVPTNEEGHDR